MRMFFILLKKEVKELLTPHVLLPMAATMILLLVIGRVASRERENVAAAGRFGVVDLDGSAASTAAVAELVRPGRPASRLTAASSKAAVAAAQAAGLPSLIVIPPGFGGGLAEGRPQEVEVYALLKGLSLSASLKTLGVARPVASLNETVSRALIASKTPRADPEFLRKPVTPKDFVVFRDRQAGVSMAQLINVIQLQALLVPVVMLMVIIVAAQMVATAVANEKENKTLETLLSLPIERDTIVYAKLGGAALVAFLFAGFYMAGFQLYLSDITRDLGQGGSPSELASAMAALGLTLSPLAVLLLGCSLFLGILCALAIAMILGLLAEDVKGVQVVTLPLIVIVMLPYMLTMMMDVQSAPPGLRWFILAIPFSHPFLAGASLMAGDFFPVICGIVYQAFVFLSFVALASRIFASEAVFSIRLRWRARPPGLD